MRGQLTAAVVGTGFIGPVHVEALLRAGVRVAGIVGSTADKSREAARKLGLPRGYPALGEVLADESVDVVHLATPNRLHFEQAKAVLAAGKHVLCEKPLAMDARQSAELVAIAARSGRAAGVAYNIRFYPLCHEAAARIAGGDFGEVLHVHGSYVQDWLLYETDFNWRVMAADCGESRAMADVGSHWLDLVQFITGQHVASVCADLQIVHPRRQRSRGSVETFAGKGAAPRATEAVSVTNDDAGCVLLRFENGARGSLHVSQTTAGRKNCVRFEIAGSQQSMSFNSEEPNTLWLGHRDRANETLTRDPALLSPMAAEFSTYPGGHNEGYPDTFKQLFRAFYGYIAAGDFTAAAPFPTFEDGHREILLCEAILKSHREERWIEIGGNPI